VRWWWKKRPNSAPAVISKVEEELTGTRKKTLVDALKIGGGAIIIFLAGNLLVEETIYFSELFGVPGSIIGLLVLSVGTNVPELVIAIRAIRKKSMDIAFGDYLGSVVANAVIFGLLALLNGGFSIEPSSFYFTAGIMVLGFIALFLFSVTKDTLSRREGLILVWLYSVFLVSQFVNVARLLSH
jgi:cation:H+ antiporter